MNALVSTTEEIKLYYSGFDAIARFVPEKDHWECTVVNTADPVDFRIKDKNALQETLVQYLEDYREYCKDTGKFSKKLT